MPNQWPVREMKNHVNGHSGKKGCVPCHSLFRASFAAATAFNISSLLSVLIAVLSLAPRTLSKHTLKCLPCKIRADWQNITEQYGGVEVCLHMHKRYFLVLGAVNLSGANPFACLWEPSQKGCFADRPQVHLLVRGSHWWKPWILLAFF